MEPLTDAEKDKLLEMLSENFETQGEDGVVIFPGIVYISKLQEYRKKDSDEIRKEISVWEAAELSAEKAKLQAELDAAKAKEAELQAKLSSL